MKFFPLTICSFDSYGALFTLILPYFGFIYFPFSLFFPLSFLRGGHFPRYRPLSKLLRKNGEIKNKPEEKKFKRYCSETTLTGESQFHITTPLGIEPRSLMTGSKQVNHWTSGTVCGCSETAGSPQGSPPQQLTMSVMKPE
jgi:hypothetical protein